MKLRKTLAAALTTLALVACEPTVPPVLGGTTVANRAAALGVQDCDWMAGVAATSGAPTMSVVTDLTASRAATAWPDGLVAAVADVARAGGTLSIIGVDGEGAPPVVVWSRRPLLPTEVRGTPREAAAVEIALACALRASRGALPTRPGSDIVGAWNAGVNAIGDDRTGARLALLTDGFASAGPLRLDRGVDPGESPVAEVAAAVVDGRRMARLDGLDVVVHGLGELADQPVDEATRRWLEELYGRLCDRGAAARCTVTRDAGPPAAARGQGPADPVALTAPAAPVVTPQEEPDVRRLTGNTFFQPGSAYLRPGAANDLAALASMLAPGGGYRAEIVGHVASWGDEGYRDRLAAARAESIRAALEQLGADPAALVARGAGSRERLVDDLDAAGQLIPAQAAQNRRVDVRLGTV